MSKTQTATVRRHHVPNWLRLRCMKAFGTTARDSEGWHVLQHAIAMAQRMVKIHDPSHVDSIWLDRWGSLRLPSGELCFVSDSHLSYPPCRQAMIVPHLLAMVVDARLLIEPTGRHGCRLTFKPND